MKKIFENKPRLFFWTSFLLVLILLISSFFVLENQARNPKYLATVNNETITEGDLDYEIFGRYLDVGPEGSDEISEDQKKLILNELVVSKISSHYLNENGAEIADDEIDNYITENLTPDEYNGIMRTFSSYTESEQEAIRASIKNHLNTEKVKNEFIQSKNGEYLFFRFDKYIDLGQETKAEGTGTKKLIDEQREYAKNLAEKVSIDLGSGKISFSEAKEIIINDPEISASAFAPLTPNMMGYFSADEYQNNLNLFDPSVYSGFKEGLASYKEGDFTKPILLKAYAEEGYVDIAYVVATVEESNEPLEANDDYEQWLSKKNQDYEVQTFWPYSFWDTALQRIRDIFTREAEAANDDTCSAPYAGSHLTNLRLMTLTQGSSGQTYRADVSVEITAGPVSSTDGLRKYFATNCSYMETGQSVDRKDNTGNLYLNNNGGSFKRPALIDCSKTNYSEIHLPSGDGRWEIDTSTATYKQWLEKFITKSDGSAIIVLKLGTTGSWANGTLVTKRVVWHQNPTPPPSPTSDPDLTYYKVRPHVEFLKINANGSVTSVREASPGDTIQLNQTIANATNTTVPEVYVRNNINNNGISGSGDGTIGSPYSVRSVTGGTTKSDASIVCAALGCHSLVEQGSGSYSTPDYDRLLWRMRSVRGSLIGEDTYEEPDVVFTIPNNSDLIGKYISNANNAWGVSKRSAYYASEPGYMSNVALLKIVSDKTLTVKINPANSGRVIGGLNNDGPFDCTSTDGCTKTYEHNETTEIEAVPLAGYSFTNWSGNDCPMSDNNKLSLTMSTNRTCTANFVADVVIIPTLSCTVTPKSGLAPLDVSVKAVAEGVDNPRFDYDMNYVPGGDITWEYIDRSTPIYYTYKTGDDYKVRVRLRGPNIVEACTPSVVNVSNPGSGSGGEVAP